MSFNTIQVDTERLHIIPLAQDELRRLIDHYMDSAPELSRAYEEMLKQCVEDPSQSLWYTPWKIRLQSSGIEVGYVGFKGLETGRTEIGYGINEEYRGKGYATEAVKGLCHWAFQMKGVEAIEAETEPDNFASQRVLLKAGFLETGRSGEEGPRFVLASDLLDKWRETMKGQLAEAHTFEIHCWEDEKKAIELAMEYGQKRDFNWDYGTEILYPQPVKRTIRDNIIELPYSLHDMRVTELIRDGNQLTMKFEDGFEKNQEPCIKVEGEINFYHVDWDFCFVYVLDFCANEGKFKGEKLFLADFINANGSLNFEIVDETYGYNMSKFAGYLTAGRKLKECTIELYHFGDMEYVTNEGK